jgi:hypothetical protein
MGISRGGISKERKQELSQHKAKNSSGITREEWVERFVGNEQKRDSLVIRNGMERRRREERKEREGEEGEKKKREKEKEGEGGERRGVSGCSLG